MITEKDLREAIAECQGKRNPDANCCIKLAAYYTILDNITESKKEDSAPRQVANYVDVIDYDGESEFAKMIDGQDLYKIMDIVDELMETLHVINPRLYESVMQKISTL